MVDNNFHTIELFRWWVVSGMTIGSDPSPQCASGELNPDRTLDRQAFYHWAHARDEHTRAGLVYKSTLIQFLQGFKLKTLKTNPNWSAKIPMFLSLFLKINIIRNFRRLTWRISIHQQPEWCRGQLWDLRCDPTPTDALQRKEDSYWMSEDQSDSRLGDGTDLCCFDDGD